MVDPPSKKLDDLLRGRTTWQDADEAIQSWARLTIWKAARTIHAESDQKRRRAMLARLPETLRPVAHEMIGRM